MKMNVDKNLLMETMTSYLGTNDPKITFPTVRSFIRLEKVGGVLNDERMWVCASRLGEGHYSTKLEWSADMTPLEAVCYFPSRGDDVLRELLANGADPLIGETPRDTPLLRALAAGSKFNNDENGWRGFRPRSAYELVKEIMKRGAFWIERGDGWEKFPVELQESLMKVRGKLGGSTLFKELVEIWPIHVEKELLSMESNDGEGRKMRKKI